MGSYGLACIKQLTCGNALSCTGAQMSADVLEHAPRARLRTWALTCANESSNVWVHARVPTFPFP
ncbi:hypothetical protein HMPREF3190_00325 [Umbribacter vaginalis]|nr:hypothetical protein HMPREF3190_00325 [Coriobacteriales bacterium DNF00809]